jgi:hypothetical protein
MVRLDATSTNRSFTKCTRRWCLTKPRRLKSSKSLSRSNSISIQKDSSLKRHSSNKKSMSTNWRRLKRSLSRLRKRLPRSMTGTRLSKPKSVSWRIPRSSVKMNTLRQSKKRRTSWFLKLSEWCYLFVKQKRV